MWISFRHDEHLIRGWPRARRRPYAGFV